MWRFVPLLLLFATPAMAQNAVTQNGAITNQHPAIWRGDRQIGDAGGLTGQINGPFIGRGLSPFSITDNNGLGLCFNTAPTTSTYSALCFGHKADGSPVATINGTEYPFPFTSGGGVFGPNSTTLHGLVTWNNTIGTLVSAPGTTYLDAQGLNLAKGFTPTQNGTGSTLQVIYSGDVDTGGHQSSPVYTRNQYTGSDPLANPNGIYGTLWYAGTIGNDASAVKGNFYTYDSSRPFHGTEPNAYIDGPSMGTLPIAAGVYGRVAHYLPGTLHEAASVFADGIFNIGTIGGSIVDNWSNFLAAAPYSTAAANSYVLRVTGGGCSPNCWNATIVTTGDPMIFKTGGGQDIRLQPAGHTYFGTTGAGTVSGSSALPGLYAYMTTGADAYLDAVSNASGAARLHLRSYAGGGVYPEAVLDEFGTFLTYAGTRTTGIGGSGNLAGMYSYMTTAGNAYLDSIVGGGNASTLHLRTYNNGTYSDSQVDSAGRFFPAESIVLATKTFGTLPTCSGAIEGAFIRVSDSNVSTWGTLITGSGANRVAAYCGASGWTVAAK